MKFTTHTLAAFLIALSACAPSYAIVSHDDPGGSVPQRVAQIERLKASGERVEVTGKYCNSACTMYLALENMCTTRNTAWGFHGPSSGLPGLPLAHHEFERWTMVMAEHYPQPLRRWFMEEARDELIGVTRISGADMIERYGVEECGQ